MSNMTPIFGLYSPDDAETVEPDIYTAMMMQSVEDSLGPRIQKQELVSAAFLNIQDAFTLTAGDPGQSLVPLPFRIGDPGLNYLKGDLTLNGGMLTVTTPGLYNVSATIAAYTPGESSLSYLELALLKNNSRHGQVYQYSDGKGTTQAPCLSHTTLMSCATGDTIWASGAQYYGDYTKPPTLNVNFAQFNTLSVALVQAS